MKKITLIVITLFTFALASCNGPKTNSYDCKDRFDVQLVDGSAMWVYSGSVSDGFVKGNDEEGHKVWVSMSQVISIIEVDCGNGE